MTAAQRPPDSRGPAGGRDPFFSTANLLSLSRIPLAGVFWLALKDERALPWAPLAVLGVAGVTDVLDGYFARRAHRGEPPPIIYGRGAWIDPICDKVFVGLVLAALIIERAPPPGLLAMIFARELIQIPVSLVYALRPALRSWLHYDFTATRLGKATTVLQYAAIAAVLRPSPAVPYLAAASLVAGLLAVGDYLHRAVTLARERENKSRP